VARPLSSRLNLREIWIKTGKGKENLEKKGGATFYTKGAGGQGEKMSMQFEKGGRGLHGKEKENGIVKREEYNL